MPYIFPYIKFTTYTVYTAYMEFSNRKLYTVPGVTMTAYPYMSLGDPPRMLLIYFKCSYLTFIPRYLCTFTHVTVMGLVLPYTFLRITRVMLDTFFLHVINIYIVSVTEHSEFVLVHCFIDDKGVIRMLGIRYPRTFASDQFSLRARLLQR